MLKQLSTPNRLCRGMYVVLLACLGGTASAGAERLPIKVFIIGVPCNGVSTYSSSDLGASIAQRCTALEALFPKDKVDTTVYCRPENTKRDFVNGVLENYFQTDLTGRVTLLFFMAHGEVTDKGDVRLLMSDTDDNNKRTHVIKVRDDIVRYLGDAVDSTTLVFVDACYSSAAAGARLPLLGSELAQEHVYSGILAAAEPYAQTHDVLFTRALVEAFRQDCAKNADELSESVLKRMGSDKSSPVWCIKYTGSLCLSDLLSPKNGILSIWRDPGYEVTVFDESTTPPHVVAAIAADKQLNMPAQRALRPGVYQIQTIDEQKGEAVDIRNVDLISTPWFAYWYPPGKRPEEVIVAAARIYNSALQLGYSDAELSTLTARAAVLAGQLPPNRGGDGGGGDGGGRPVQHTLGAAINGYKVGGGIPYASFIEDIGDPAVEVDLKTAMFAISTSDLGRGAASLKAASESARASKVMPKREAKRLGNSLSSAAKALSRGQSPEKVLQAIESALRVP